VSDVAFKGKQVVWDAEKDAADAAHDAKVQSLCDQLVRAMGLPVWPASIEVHCSPDGKVQKVEAHVVPWRRPGKA
jgi:hypothetical protein